MAEWRLARAMSRYTYDVGGILTRARIHSLEHTYGAVRA